MARSVVDICNLALSRLGEQEINVIGQDSVAGRLMSRYYQQTVDSELRKHNWICALERKALNRLTEDPVTSDWNYQFQLPVDPYCLKVISIPEYPTQKYVREGRKLLTNTTSVKIKFIKRIVDPNDFDSCLVEVLATALAMKVSFPITGDKTMKDTLATEYAYWMDEAESANEIESEDLPPEDTSWVDAGRD